jgi:plastocyanin
MRTLHRCIGVASLALAASFCGGSGPTSVGGGGGGGGGGGSCTPSPTTVCLETGNTFNPGSLTVSAGTTVTWDNQTGVTHNVTFDAKTGAPTSSANFASGTFTATFPAAGTYPYHCTIHGLSMSGTVVVQ